MTRYIAQITFETNTPLKVGSNASDFLQDAPIQKDWNNSPMILGTSIAGVLRKEFNESQAKSIFGDNKGSKIIFSNALLLNEINRVHEDLLLEKTPFLKIFNNLPVREHTAITDKGVAKEHSKFDEEVVYKGTRFKFSIEVLEDEKIFNEILEMLRQSHIRFGGGSTKGFGKFTILEIATQEFSEENYATYSSSLNYQLKNKKALQDSNSTEYTTYTLNIKPDDFYMFGSGFGDSDADMTPVYEQVIDYENQKLSAKEILIPASSIKGALSHRTAYHYNKKMLEKGKDHTQTVENNAAVKAIFGHKKELSEDKKTELGQKGKILISDCFQQVNKDEVKVFDHVSIDRFTGGAIDGALFQEKTVAKNNDFTIEILLENDIDSDFNNAFENALKDICCGMLPLGGATTKGHGVFSGEVLINGKKL